MGPHTRRGSIRRAAVTLALGLLSAPALSADDPASVAGIRERLEAHQTAWNARDAAGVAAVYAPDGDLIVGASPRHRGREAIQSASEAMLSRLPKERLMSTTVYALRFLGPDVAIVESVARFSDGANLGDRSTWILVRQQGAWLVAALRVMPAERVSK